MTKTLLIALVAVLAATGAHAEEEPKWRQAGERVLGGYVGHLTQAQYADANCRINVDPRDADKLPAIFVVIVDGKEMCDIMVYRPGMTPCHCPVEMRQFICMPGDPCP